MKQIYNPLLVLIVTLFTMTSCDALTEAFGGDDSNDDFNVYLDDSKSSILLFSDVTEVTDIWFGSYEYCSVTTSVGLTDWLDLTLTYDDQPEDDFYYGLIDLSMIESAMDSDHEGYIYITSSQETQTIEVKYFSQGIYSYYYGDDPYDGSALIYAITINDLRTDVYSIYKFSYDDIYRLKNFSVVSQSDEIRQSWDSTISYGESIGFDYEDGSLYVYEGVIVNDNEQEWCTVGNEGTFEFNSLGYVDQKIIANLDCEDLSVLSVDTTQYTYDSEGHLIETETTSTSSSVNDVKVVLTWSDGNPVKYEEFEKVSGSYQEVVSISIEYNTSVLYTEANINILMPLLGIDGDLLLSYLYGAQMKNIPASYTQDGKTYYTHGFYYNTGYLDTYESGAFDSIIVTANETYSASDEVLCVLKPYYLEL